jgi:tRNA U34 5-carboxymethylaminomethyl modifying GTPase MnmE/TrmE
VSALRASLVGLEALLAHHIDFPEEDDAPVPGGDIAGRAEALGEEIDALLATAPEGELLREGRWPCSRDGRTWGSRRSTTR